MPEEIEIKPCPFCGSTQVHMRDMATFPYVFCEQCNAYGPSMETKEEAILMWNKANGVNADLLATCELAVTYIEDGAPQTAADRLRKAIAKVGDQEASE
jgi:Lar family restriction alleviation protein